MSDPNSDFENDLQALRPRAVSPELRARLGNKLKPLSANTPRLARWIQRRNLGALDVAALIGIAVLLGLLVKSQYDAWMARAPKAIHSAAGDGETALTPEENAKLAELLKALADPEFDTRQKAKNDLMAFGEKALKALENLKRADDAETWELAHEAIRGIKGKAILVTLERLSPGLGKILSTPLVSDRQNAIFVWAKAVDRRTLAPVIVEATQLLDPSPQLWGCWEALNCFAAQEAFVGSYTSAWAGAEHPSVTRQLEDIYNSESNAKTSSLQFTAAARKLCDANASVDQNDSAPPRVAIGNQTYRIGVGFCFDAANSKIQVMTAAEGGRYWSDWYRTVKDTREWQPGDHESPTANNIAEWTTVLQGADAAASRKAMARLSEAWDDENVRAAVQRAAADSGAGARFAKELLIRAGLRGAGQIVFNCKDPGEKMAVWTMNADGSAQQPLLPDDYKTRNWWSFAPPVDGRFLLIDWDSQGLYWWKPGMKTPKLIEDLGARDVMWRNNNSQLVYFKPFNRAGGAGSVKVYDFATEQSADLIKGALDSVDHFTPSPDKRSAAFIQVKKPELQDGTYHGDVLMTIDLNSGAAKEMLPLPEGLRQTGQGIEWSSDGRYLALSAYMTDPQYKSQLWVVDVQTGVVTDIAKPYRSIGNTPWSHTGARLAFFAERTREEARSLVIYEPGKPPAEYPDPDKVRGHAISGGYVEWLDDGRLVLSSSTLGKFLFDPDHPESAQPLPAGEIFPGHGAENTVKSVGETWSISEADGLPGIFARQIVLLSRDGKTIVPLTNRPGGCSGAHFLKNH